MAHNLSLCWIRPKGNKGHYWLTTLKGFSAAHCAVKWYQLFSFHNYLALQTYALSSYSSKFLRRWAKSLKKTILKSHYWSLPKSTFVLWSDKTWNAQKIIVLFLSLFLSHCSVSCPVTRQNRLSKSRPGPFETRPVPWWNVKIPSQPVQWQDFELVPLSLLPGKM